MVYSLSTNYEGSGATKYAFNDNKEFIYNGKKQQPQ